MERRNQQSVYFRCQDPNHFNAKPKLAAEYWNLYQTGLSAAEIGRMHSVGRNSVHGLLRSHGYKLREKKRLPFITFNGAKYTLKPSGYYARTDGKRSLLHRDVWEYYNGQIPNGWDVHHINEIKEDNRLGNLDCIPKGEHTRHHTAKRKESTRRS